MQNIRDDQINVTIDFGMKEEKNEKRKEKGAKDGRITPVNSLTVILKGFNRSPNFVTTSWARAFMGAM